jgi:bleomycin hydrolase
MAASVRGKSARDVLSREWILDASERSGVGLAKDEDVNLRRLRRRGFETAALNAEIVARHNRRYSLQLRFGTVANQEQSGRCWLFAPVVLARAAALRNGRIAPAESFSATYLYFFSLLEQASATLNGVHRITARKDAVTGDTLRRGVSTEVMGLGDGGEWEWAFNLIEKYGLVPSRAMPETASSKNTKALAVDLHERLARAARAISRAPDNYREVREHAVRDVIRILVAHLGVPPRVVTSRREALSPIQYSAQVVGFRPAEWRVVISNPLLPFDRAYERRGTAISADSPRFNLRRLNVSQARQRELVRSSIEAGYAIGFSADVDRNDIDHRRGIMHPSIFNRTRIYGSQIIRDLPRREDIYLGIASSKHAMAIVGVDVTKAGSSPLKYKVVNSWGPDLGDGGVYHMYADWFEENVFKLALHESVLDQRERVAYRDPDPLPGRSFY